MLSLRRQRQTMVRRSSFEPGKSGQQRPPARRRSAVGSVRVIGGRWRGRKLDVIDSPGLRPSPDRLRETLFNWLAPVLPGARCLDLFAGSGSLGIEAASRGAAHVTLVEREPAVAERLRQNLARLDVADEIVVVQSDWAAALGSLAGDWDIVFVDPPFEDGLHASVLQALGDNVVAEDARIHIESAVRDEVVVPPEFTVLRDKRFGDVQARLLGQKGPSIASAQ